MSAPGMSNLTSADMLDAFVEKSGIQGVDHVIRHRSDGSALILRMANPTERFFRILSEIAEQRRPEVTPLPTIERRSPINRLSIPETSYFLRTLSESLNINRYSFRDDFFRRYTKSVSNAEAQITAATNHIVYGRRGAGKSSLLLYAMRSREIDKKISIWIDMQTFEKRKDLKVALEIIQMILDDLRHPSAATPAIRRSVERLIASKSPTDDQVRALVPDLRRAMMPTTGDMFLILDDFHLLDSSIQPKILSFLYSISRGNKILMKISAIETLTKPWDARSRDGMQVPHDAQLIKLDYNLTMPDMAEKHIEGILDAHAIYCGLPSVRYLCVVKDVLFRLVWVSAGVPRDALNMFAQALKRAMTANRTRVSVTDINLAASEMVSEKLRDIEVDVLDTSTENNLQETLEIVKDFCIRTVRKNAFLVEIKRDSSLFHSILELVDLRLIHVINEGITVGDAGRKYIALILDYGFYTGIRSAQSVDLFNKNTKRVSYKELRKLPILKFSSKN